MSRIVTNQVLYVQNCNKSSTICPVLSGMAELSGDNDHDRDCKGILNLRLCLQFRNKPLTKAKANFKDFPEFNLGF